MNLISLFDGPSAAIVVGGTLVATAMRAGAADCGVTLTKLARLGQSRFNAVAVRAELALQIQEIRKDGIFRAHPHHMGDAEFDDASDALVGTRSVEALLERHEAHKRRRLQQSNRAVATLAQAAELAPVFGLVGTLVSLSQLPAQSIAGGTFTAAISMAVLTTLYGVILGNLVLAPLARLVERKAHHEEAQRQAVIDWLATQVADACPPQRGVHAPRAAA